MKTTAKIQVIGTGHYISIPVQVRRLMNLKEGSIVELDLKIPIDTNMKSYRCLACMYRFDMDTSNEEIYCPCCNNEDPEAIKEVENER
jgi:Zn finger protein HypA/HybF involved in hydrogenase expression